jgi:hypothetical protein
MWQAMRGPVIENFPEAPGGPRNLKVDTKRVNDAALEKASVRENIVLFTVFLADLVSRRLAGESLPSVLKNAS